MAYRSINVHKALSLARMLASNWKYGISNTMHWAPDGFAYKRSSQPARSLSLSPLSFSLCASPLSHPAAMAVVTQRWWRWDPARQRPPLAAYAALRSAAASKSAAAVMVCMTLNMEVATAGEIVKVLHPCAVQHRRA